MTQESDLPPLLQMGTSFLRSVARHLSEGMPRADEETQSHRKKKCDECEYLRKDKRCSLCGCHAHIKLKWRGEQCPDGRW